MMILLQLRVSSVPAGRAKGWNAKRLEFPASSKLKQVASQNGSIDGAVL
jgi:hypothetical protein